MFKFMSLTVPDGIDKASVKNYKTLINNMEHSHLLEADSLPASQEIL
jgi:hypothetical protein